MAGPAGFLAAPGDAANYGRVWARDGIICGLAGLLTGKPDLVRTMERTLDTLRLHQGPNGEIPSNVGANSAVSYGSLAGRADAPLWYVIGCTELAARDAAVLERHEAAMRKALRLCAAWEYNRRGLIYVPMGGSWADEYILHGYVLYVQLLYLWALRSAGRALADAALTSRAQDLEDLVRANYWLKGAPTARPYHPVAYARIRSRDDVPDYWLASFHPGGYEEVFDGLGNALALLLGLGQAEAIGAFVKQTAGKIGSYLTPAFYPPITPESRRWADLESYYIYKFRNLPWEYHNGGLWPMVTGFMAAGLAAAGQRELALRLADAIDAANSKADWGFYEFHHGLSHQPMGVRQTAWSAAGAVIAHHVVREKRTLLSY